jgi:hypothetical protein
MSTFLIVLAVYMTTLLYLNAKLNPDGKQVPAHLEAARKILYWPGRVFHLILLGAVAACLRMLGQYVLHLLGYAEHPFPR